MLSRKTSSLGVSTRFWTAHSTRGAEVGLYRQLGFSAEEVCEIRQLKNTEAFAKHYQRLGAKDKTQSILGTFVHNISHTNYDEPDLSQTPCRNAQGGSDKEGEAQEASVFFH